MVRISNFELLKELKKNARESYTKIAKKFGVTEAAIRKRVKQLVSSGIITRFTIEVNCRKVGMIRAIIGVDASPEEYGNVIEKLMQIKEIDSMYTSSGDHMLMIDICFRDPQELFHFIKNLKSIRGVTKVCPAILMEKLI